MYLLKVIPSSYIPLPAPQSLTYFFATDIEPGGLVLVPVGKRKAIGVVESSENMEGQKMNLRKSEFELRPVLEIISTNQILNKQQLELAKWIQKYYWSPIGAVIKAMIPEKIKNYKAGESGQNTIKNSQKLILVPELSQIEDAVKKAEKQYPGRKISILHGKLTDKKHLEAWQEIRNCESEIIIGSRLALFAPFQNLAEIIIKNEHSASYKAQKNPRIHARETAIKLAGLWQADIIFESNTPSIETYWNITQNKNNLKLATGNSDNKIPNYKLPIASLIDLKTELKDGNFSIFSRKLQEEIELTLNNKKQIILFINRRGSSTVLMCRDCGHVPKCPDCDVPMVYHLSPIQFVCHHCGHSEIPPVLCPNCLGTRIKFFGTGAQKVEMEFKKLFPAAKAARLDSDVAKNSRLTRSSTPYEELNSQSTEQQIIENFKNKNIQVLIGTQMIFNKNIPQIPLVAMMLADTLIHLPDFRSNERNFQIISQLKKMAAENFLLQTYSPENEAVRFAIKNDYKSFYQNEIETRKELSYPPFSQLIKLAFAHKSPKKAEDEAKIMAEKFKQQIIANSKLLTGLNKKTDTINLQPITILGPSPAFISKIRGKYIWQIILKSKISDLKLRNKILKIVTPDWTIDVDPLQII